MPAFLTLTVTTLLTTGSAKTGAEREKYQLSAVFEMYHVIDYIVVKIYGSFKTFPSFVCLFVFFVYTCRWKSIDAAEKRAL